MSDVLKYRVWCNTEMIWKTQWRDAEEGEPTVCPSHGHPIDLAKTSIVEIRPDSEKRNPDGSMPVRLSSPEEKDGKPILSFSPSNIKRRTYFTGRGDDLSLPFPTSLGKGPRFLLKFQGVGELGGDGTPEGGGAVPEHHFVDFRFNQPVEFHDGQISWSPPANFGMYDIAYLHLIMPATQLTPVPLGTGNCIILPTPLGGVVIPYGTGTHDFDLADCTPIPAPNGDGYFNVDPFTGEVTVANIVQEGLNIIGDGGFHLIDQEITHPVVQDLNLVNPLGVFDIDAYRVEWYHPSWLFRFGAVKYSSGSGVLGGWMLMFR